MIQGIGAWVARAIIDRTRNISDISVIVLQFMPLVVSFVQLMVACLVLSTLIVCVEIGFHAVDGAIGTVSSFKLEEMA